MAFQVKKRGKLTYHDEGDRPVLSALITDARTDGDLKIYFTGLTGGYSTRSVLGWDELASMDRHRKVPLAFARWERWLRDVDLIEMYTFGYQPAAPNRWSTRLARWSSSNGGGRRTRGPTPAGLPIGCPIMACRAGARRTWRMAATRRPLTSFTASPSCNGPEPVRADTLEYTSA